MTKQQKTRWIGRLALLLACVVLLASQFERAGARVQQAETAGATSQAQDDGIPEIENDPELPAADLGAAYEMRFRARADRPALHWRLRKGELPPGIKLEDNGLLHGQPERAGEFRFTVWVTDDRTQDAVLKEFLLRVRPDTEAREAESPQEEHGIVIETDSELPDTYPHARFEMRLRAHGAISAMHWKVLKGALPQGIKLEDDGLLHGEPQNTGEFQFTVAVTDVRAEHAAVQKGFVLRVLSALSLNWKNPARVSGNRIEGSVEVSNATPDDMDLTFVAMAVASNGRGTAIGYQHFVLPKGTVAKELPFGETLPHGGYVIHVDAVGEVPPKNLIYRKWMETPGPLQVTVGP